MPRARNSRSSRSIPGAASAGAADFAAIPGQPDAGLASAAALYDRPSKSQRKRDMLALQELGEALVASSRERLAKVELPDTLRDAIREAQRITDHEGRRRQMQYIGKLMRNVDPEPIAAALAAWRGESGAATARLHALERWRDRLLADDSALDSLCAQYTAALNPDTLQRLRQHVRLARKEQAAARPPKHYRELFQVLKDVFEAHDQAGAGAPPAADGSDHDH